MTERPQMRPEPAKNLSPQERADLRTEELKVHGVFDDSEVHDEYAVPVKPPEGWHYEWRRRLILNQEDSSYDSALHRMGWEEVPASRHPELMPPNYKGTTILRKGLVLMERPLAIVEESRRRDARRARLQVQTKEEQLSAAPNGQFERQNKDASLVKVKKGYSPVQIPE